MIFQPNLVVRVLEDSEPEVGEVPIPYTTTLIGPDSYPLTTSRRSTVYQAHYSGGQPFRGPVRKLTFLQLGNKNIPDMSSYARTCKSVVFNGHISSVYLAMSILSQLPKVRSVAFLIGQSQHEPYFEEEHEFYSQTPFCPQIKRLKVSVDLRYFHSFSHDTISVNPLTQEHLNLRQRSMVFLVECIIKHSMDSFPNIHNLNVDLPDYDPLHEAVQIMISECPLLRSKTSTRVEVISLGGSEEAAEACPVADSGYSSSPTPTRVGEMPPLEDGFMPAPYPYPLSPVVYHPGSVPNMNLVPDQLGFISPSPGLAQQHFIFPALAKPEVVHRPPPGFLPLPPSPPIREMQGRGVHGVLTGEVYQRVNIWLTTSEQYV